MTWLLTRLAHWLIGPGLTNMTDEAMDGITLAIHEEAARLGVAEASLEMRGVVNILETVWRGPCG